MMKNSTYFLALAVCGLFALSTTNAMAQPFTEGFDDITTLEGDGWAMINNSNPVGVTTWSQGPTTVFIAVTGDTSSYISANFNSTTGTGTIDTWLLTPEREFANWDEITFYTIAGGGGFADRLEVRMSTNGASVDVGSTATEVGDFTMLLEEINPTLADDYPTAWTQYTITISGLDAPTSGRIAFRYFVTEGGPTGSNSNIIGIDEVVFTEGTVGINESSSSLGLSVYPNPGNGMYTLEMDLNNYDNVTVEAVDLQGKIVYSKDLSNKSNNFQVIDLNSVANGIYFLKVNADNNVDVIKVIKN